MALTTSQKVLVWTVAVMTLAGVGYFATQHVKTLKKVNKEKKSRKRSIKSDSSASTSNTETIPITKVDSAKTRKSTSDSAKKLSESAAAVVRGEKMLSSKEKEALAGQLKEEGNKLFNDALYKEASQLYTEAIQLQPTNPIYYCNRAACYTYLNEHQLVIADCSKALELDKTYIKALHRRASAYEQVKQFRDALNDLSVVTVLEKFKKESTVMETDRLIKLIVEKEAMTVPLNDFNKFPSQFFIDAYFNSFLPIDYPEFEEQPEPESLEAYLKIALQCIEMKDYEKALEEAKMGAKRCDEVDDNIFASYLLNVYGTLLFLQGRTELATEILEKSIQRNPTLVNSVAKICNLYLERGDADGALEAFNTAIRKFPKSADLYYHRGQLKFLMNDFKSATQDFQKTIELDPGHVFGHVQCAVAQFKNGIIEPAMKLFEQTKQKFPTSPDVHCYYGELLMEQHKFDQAMENFDKAIQLGSTMAYIDKAMLLHRVFQKSEEASTLLRQVLALDSNLDLAHIQLGIVLLNQHKEQEGIKSFDLAIQSARNFFELTNSISAKEHALAQYHVQQYLPPGAF